MEPDSVIFECKEGPFVEHEVDGILIVEKKCLCRRLIP
jgi:hypothetical protein